VRVAPVVQNAGMDFERLGDLGERLTCGDSGADKFCPR